MGLTEAQEQINLINYLKLKGYKYTAIPNNTFTPSWGQKIKNKSMGLMKGFPDLVVILPFANGNRHLIAIELKKAKLTLKSGKLSSSNSTTYPEQQEWVDELNKCEGIGAYICYGAEEAKNLIKTLCSIQ